MYHRKLFILSAFFLLFVSLHAQETVTIDTSRILKKDTVVPSKDSVKFNPYNPKKAAIRSALIPGWGQFYNKRYWKIPIVYGALGISGSVFVFNLKNYRDFRFAYKARIEASTPRVDPGTGVALPPDSTNYNKLDQVYKVLDPNAIRTYRDSYRRSIDYSALFFILLWGLNVVDATVDAHLRSFDVSPELSFHLKFGRSQLAGTTGLSFVLAFK